MHKMNDASLSVAPLENSGKLVPRKSKIPIKAIVADAGPSFLDLYGNFIYLMGIVVFATYVYHPQLKKRWDINQTSNEKKFVAAYIFYFIFCFAVWKWLLKPALGLPDVDAKFFSLMKKTDELNL